MTEKKRKRRTLLVAARPAVVVGRDPNKGVFFTA